MTYVRSLHFIYIMYYENLAISNTTYALQNRLPCLQSFKTYHTKKNKVKTNTNTSPNSRLKVHTISLDSILPLLPYSLQPQIRKTSHSTPQQYLGSIPSPLPHKQFFSKPQTQYPPTKDSPISTQHLLPRNPVPVRLAAPMQSAANNMRQAEKGCLCCLGLSDIW